MFKPMPATCAHSFGGSRVSLPATLRLSRSDRAIFRPWDQQLATTNTLSKKWLRSSERSSRCVYQTMVGFGPSPACDEGRTLVGQGCSLALHRRLRQGRCAHLKHRSKHLDQWSAEELAIRLPPPHHPSKPVEPLQARHQAAWNASPWLNPEVPVVSPLLNPQMEAEELASLQPVATAVEVPIPG